MDTVRGSLLPDEALLAAHRDGDPDAFGVLFDRHRAAVRRLAAQLVGTQSCELDDLVQSTFLEALRGTGRFVGRGSLRSYLFGIVANLVRRHRRTVSRRCAAYARWPHGPGPERPDTTTLRGEQLLRLAAALETLPASPRTAYVLCSLAELPGVEVARMLDVPPGTVARWLHEARRALREAIDGVR